MKPVRPSRGINVIAVAVLTRLLLAGNRSMEEIAAETGLNVNTVQRYCAAFHNAGVAYIADWRLDGRGAYSIRIYQLGEGVDVRPPTRAQKQNAERARAQRAGRPFRTHTRQHAYGSP